jgi:hypothetical protein
MQAPPRLNDAGACIGNACIYNACICYPLLRRSAESSPSERGFSPARLALITCALPTDADAAAPRAAEAAAELISTIPVPRTSPTARAGAPRLRRIAGRAAGPGRYGVPSAGQRRRRRRRAPGRLCPQSLTAPMTSLASPRAGGSGHAHPMGKVDKGWEGLGRGGGVSHRRICVVLFIHIYNVLCILFARGRLGTRRPTQVWSHICVAYGCGSLLPSLAVSDMIGPRLQDRSQRPRIKGPESQCRTSARAVSW